MRILLAVASALAGAWIIAGPWLNLGASAGGNMGMGQTMTANPGDAAVLTWHLIPGALALLVAVPLLFVRDVRARRWLGVALFAVGFWAAAGPWILPQFGLGSMTMGLSSGSFLRHILPGTVLALCGVAVFFTVPSRHRRAATLSSPSAETLRRD